MSLKGKMNAWIKPSGQFISIGYMKHNEWASEYFEKKYGWKHYLEKIEEINENKFGRYPYEALHKLGWIRLLTWADGESKALGASFHGCEDNTSSPKANKKQLDTLIAWCQDNNYHFSNLFKG